MNLIERYRNKIPASEIQIGMNLIIGKPVEKEHQANIETGMIVRVIGIQRCYRKCKDNCCHVPIVVRPLNKAYGCTFSCYSQLYTLDGRLVVSEEDYIDNLLQLKSSL